MPLIEQTDYKPRFPFTNSHINTIFPAVFRRQSLPDYERERFNTSDDDFIDVDYLRNDNKRLAIIMHGLEGSSASQYVQGTARLLHANNWDVAAVNHRSCSGEMNRQLRMYHSGATRDLHEFIQHIASQYDHLVLVGFSLGGNMILKYLGDEVYPVHEKVRAAATVSVPIDLKGGSLEIARFKNKIYDYRFLQTLCEKAYQKHLQFPEAVTIENLKKVKTLWDFDEYFTGPIHGFADADDYYRRCSSKQFLHQISIPTLLVQAQDDPFLSATCYPEVIAKASSYLNLMLPRHGGHVGFSLPGSDHYWEEYKIRDFFFMILQ